MALAKLVWIVLCLLLGFESTTATGSGQTYAEAQKYCENKGGLPIPRSYKEQDILRGKLERSGISSIWLKGGRQTLMEWTWVNGTISGNIHSHESQKCAGYDQKTEDIFIAECTYKAPGHICEAKQCEDCYRDFGWKGQVCRKFGVKCFLFHCDNNNWFNSRAACSNESQDLAVLQNNNMVKWLSKLQFYCSRFWIGLRRETWTEKGTQGLVFSKWGANEPSGGNCMILKNYNGAIYWASSDCNRKFGAICADTQESSTGSVSQGHNATFPREIDKESRTSTILIAVFTVIGILLLILIPGVLYKVFRKRGLSSGGEPPTSVHEEEELIPVEETPLKALQNLLAGRSKGYCEVKMSHGAENHWFLPVEEIYTDVKIFKGRRQLKFTELMKEVKEGGNKRVLFTGNNGVGKTTVVRRILKEWSCSLFPDRANSLGQSDINFRFVIYVMLSKVEKLWKFEDILKHLFKLREKDASDICCDISKHQHECLIILDGFDEAKHNSNMCEDINEIVKGDMFPEVKVIMTCRLPTSKYLEEYWDEFKDHYLIDGFTKENIVSYVSKLSSKSSGIDISKICETEELKNLAVYPHLLRFLCNVWEEKNKTIHIYRRFLEYSLTRYNQKYPSSKLVKNSFETCVRGLGQLAIDKLIKEGRSYLHIDEIEEVSEITLQLGFLVFDGDTIQFPNTELHAYFCAYSLSTTEKENRVESIRKVFSDESLSTVSENIIKFLAGLVARNSKKAKSLQDDLSAYPDKKEIFETYLRTFAD